MSVAGRAQIAVYIVACLIAGASALAASEPGRVREATWREAIERAEAALAGGNPREARRHWEGAYRVVVHARTPEGCSRDGAAGLRSRADALRRPGLARDVLSGGADPLGHRGGRLGVDPGAVVGGPSPRCVGVSAVVEGRWETSTPHHGRSPHVRASHSARLSPAGRFTRPSSRARPPGSAASTP
jgi:hypothetical protein